MIKMKSLFTLLLLFPGLVFAQTCIPFPGTINFTTQAQIDAFATNYPGCTEIEGNVVIQGAGITNLNGLSGVTSVGGDLQFFNNSALTSLSGLSGLTSIGESLLFSNNDALSSLDGLSALVSIDGTLQLWGNDALADLNGLSSLVSVGSISILNSASLTTLEGLETLTSVGWFEITNNPALTDITGFSNLTAVGAINISGNPNVTSVSGFNGITSIISVIISDNASLTGISGLNGLTNAQGSIFITGNPALTSITGFTSLSSVGYQFSLNTNLSLTDISGLDGLSSVGGPFQIDRTGLSDLSVFDGLTSVGGFMEIYDNSALTSLDGLESLASVSEQLSILSNPVLTDISALSAVSTIGTDYFYLLVLDNATLASLDGLENIPASSLTYVGIYNNPNLAVCNLANICEYLANSGSADIFDNASGCSTAAEISAGCVFTCYLDSDGDGYGNPTTGQVFGGACGVGFVINNQDCNDSNPAVNPEGTEILNGLDDDCDGNVDNVSDSDNDGFFDAEDCRPLDPNSYPGAPEVCGDLVDNDCDGLVDEPFKFQLISEQNVSCYGGNDGAIEVTGQCGLPPYTYLWSNGATTAAISNLSKGQYRVTITDSQGLTVKKTIGISQPALLSSNLVIDELLCYGTATGQLKIKGKGGVKPYSYFWSTGETTNLIQELTAGYYSVTLTDANGCIVTEEAYLTDPPLLEIADISVTPSPGAPGKYNIVVTAAGGTPFANGSYRYRRCNSGGTGCTGWKSDNQMVNVPAGVYQVQVKDKNGCEVSELVVVGGGAKIEFPDEDHEITIPDELLNPTLLLYPNPTAGDLQLTLRGNKTIEQNEGTVEVYDITGSMVLRRKIGVVSEEPVLIDVSDLKAGAYILFLRGVEVSPVRFVIQRL